MWGPYGDVPDSIWEISGISGKYGKYGEDFKEKDEEIQREKEGLVVLVLNSREHYYMTCQSGSGSPFPVRFFLFLLVS